MNWIHNQLSKNHAFYKAHIAKGFYICLVVFLVLCTGCYFALRSMPDLAQKVYDGFSELLKQNGMLENGAVTAHGILGNNARSAAVSMALGLLPFLFLPAFSLLVNGVVIGGVLAVVAGQQGASVGQLVVFGLLPHGIFELPAILLAIAAGLWLCLNMCRLILKKPSALPLEEALPALLRLFLLTVLPLLIVAAAIEGYLTPRLIAMFVSTGGTMV